MLGAIAVPSALRLRQVRCQADGRASDSRLFRGVAASRPLPSCLPTCRHTCRAVGSSRPSVLQHLHPSDGPDDALGTVGRYTEMTGLPMLVMVGVLAAAAVVRGVPMVRDAARVRRRGEPRLPG